MDGVTNPDTRPTSDVEGEKPDRVQVKGGGEAPDADRAADAAESGSDADKDPRGAREDELLDEGLEETFPASDPVSAKHIT